MGPGQLPRVFNFRIANLLHKFGPCKLQIILSTNYICWIGKISIRYTLSIMSPYLLPIVDFQSFQIFATVFKPFSFLFTSMICCKILKVYRNIPSAVAISLRPPLYFYFEATNCIVIRIIFNYSRIVKYQKLSQNFFTLLQG